MDGEKNAGNSGLVFHIKGLEKLGIIISQIM